MMWWALLIYHFKLAQRFHRVDLAVLDQFDLKVDFYIRNDLKNRDVFSNLENNRKKNENLVFGAHF